MSAGVPAKVDGRIPLKVRPSTRVAGFLGSIFVLFLVLVIVMLLFAYPPGEIDNLLGIALWAGGVAVVLALVWGAWMTMKEAFVRQAIDFDGESISVHDPSTLRRRLQIPIQNVASIAIDSSESPGLWDADDLPIEIERDLGSVMWTAGRDETLEVTDQLTRLLLPLVGRDPELRPNLAIVLTEPLDVGSARRRTTRRGGFVKTLDAATTTYGLSACARDVHRAYEVFERTGLVRRLNSTDRRLLDPSDDDVKRIRRARIVLIVSLAFLAVLLAERVWDVVQRQ